MKKRALIIGLISGAALISGCTVDTATEAYSPEYSGYTVGYGYAPGGGFGGYSGFGNYSGYGGWASSYYGTGSAWPRAYYSGGGGGGYYHSGYGRAGSGGWGGRGHR